MDLALNNLQILICHKTKPTDHLLNCWVDYSGFSILGLLYNLTKPDWSERKWKSRLGWKIDLKSDPPTNSGFRILNLNPNINKLLQAKWQQRWNNSIHNKFFQIQPTLREWRRAFRKSRNWNEQQPVFEMWNALTRFYRMYSFGSHQKAIFQGEMFEPSVQER